MKDIKKVFSNLEEKISNSNWFKNGWEIYNRGEYMQISKENWHNHNQGGVHFETYIESPQVKNKSFPICLHAEEDCPSQQLFISKLLDAEGSEIKSWKGYKVLGEGYYICERTLPLNFKNLENKILEEFNRLRKLESTIDSILEEISS